MCFCIGGFGLSVDTVAGFMCEGECCLFVARYRGHKNGAVQQIVNVITVVCQLWS